MNVAHPLPCQEGRSREELIQLGLVKTHVEEKLLPYPFLCEDGIGDGNGNGDGDGDGDSDGDRHGG